MNKRTRFLYSDKDYLDGLKTRDSEIITAIYYNHIDLVKNLAVKNSGNEEDAEDLFQDAIIITYKKIVNEELELTSTFRTFFYSICRNLWLQRLSKRPGKVIDIADVEEYVPLSDSQEYEIHDESENRERLYLKHFGKLSSDCQKILKHFAEGKSVREIAQIMRYKSEDYAKSRKYQCKEILKRRIKNDPLYKELLDNEEE